MSLAGRPSRTHRPAHFDRGIGQSGCSYEHAAPGGPDPAHARHSQSISRTPLPGVPLPRGKRRLVKHVCKHPIPELWRRAHRKDW